MADDATKQIKVLVRTLEGRGFTAEKRGGHWKIRRPDGRMLATLPGTPSDYRTVDNTYAELRRLGVDVRRSVHKRRNSIDDHALGRLRVRLVKQLQRGINKAEFGRLVMYTAHEKHIQGPGSAKSAMHILDRILSGEGRITKPMYNSFAATLNVIEHIGEEPVLAKRIAQANAFCGLKEQRHGDYSQNGHPPASAPEPEPEPAPEPEPDQVLTIRIEIPSSERAWIRELLRELLNP